MPALGTTVIRQNYKNSNASTRGLPIGLILNDPNVGRAYYFWSLGSGVQANRVYNWCRLHPNQCG